MKKVGLVFGLTLMLSLCGRQVGIQFEKMDFKSAREKAQTEQKLLLTYFYTEW
ncbi:MAG: hypothetical protein PHC43_02870 [Candidatus Marinimicrobia bacterium]|nr:hypothetical protein [Candidatus Neomarinimicrobiota bacterium]MDD5230245.1 hypothetical protein [Candidatus Neomarinimicrobiota bacterium]